MRGFIAVSALLLAACAVAPSAAVPPGNPSTPAKSHPATGRGMRLAFVVLDTPTPTDPVAFVSEYERRWGVKVGGVEAGTAKDTAEERGTFVADVPGGHVMVGFMPAAIPWGDLELPARFAWLWSDADERLRAHQAHLIVAFTPTSTPNAVVDAIALTRVVGALLAANSAATGVYWGAGPAVQSREVVLEELAQLGADSLPVYTWIGFWPVKLDDGRRGLTTKGLAAFGLMELMLVSPNAELDELLSTIGYYAQYVLLHGPVLKDGDTFGFSDSERWPVHYVPAPWDPSVTVVQLEMP